MGRLQTSSDLLIRLRLCDGDLLCKIIGENYVTVLFARAEEMSYSEISTDLNVSITKIRKMYVDGMNKLAEFELAYSCESSPERKFFVGLSTHTKNIVKEFVKLYFDIELEKSSSQYPTKEHIEKLAEQPEVIFQIYNAGKKAFMDIVSALFEYGFIEENIYKRGEHETVEQMNRKLNQLMVQGKRTQIGSN